MLSALKYWTCLNCLILHPFQEQVRESKATPLSPDDGEDVGSPTPSAIQSTVARRGAISSEVFTEEDAASYVKKVG